MLLVVVLVVILFQLMDMIQEELVTHNRHQVLVLVEMQISATLDQEALQATQLTVVVVMAGMAKLITYHVHVLKMDKMLQVRVAVNGDLELDQR